MEKPVVKSIIISLPRNINSAAAGRRVFDPVLRGLTISDTLYTTTRESISLSVCHITSATSILPHHGICYIIRY